MDARSKALRSLTVDDIFHADSPNGASLICLVTSITDATIHAWTVTTQLGLAFNRITGCVKMDEDQIPGTIDSICMTGCVATRTTSACRRDSKALRRKCNVLWAGVRRHRAMNSRKRKFNQRGKKRLRQSYRPSLHE